MGVWCVSWVLGVAAKGFHSHPSSFFSLFILLTRLSPSEKTATIDNSNERRLFRFTLYMYYESGRTAANGGHPRGVRAGGM